MEKFNFLIGEWSLKYKVPQSVYSPEATGEGTGTFRKALNDKCVFFDYCAEMTAGSTSAHGVFIKDKISNVYKYWWFEDTGSFDSATCNFTDNHTLFMTWHSNLLVQTFKKIDEDHILLTMSAPSDRQELFPVLIVNFHRIRQ